MASILDNHELQLPYRASVITLRLLCKLSYTEIEQKLGIKTTTCRMMYTRALAAAKGCEDIHAMLAVCTPGKRSGRPEKVPEGSDKSLQIRDALMADDTTPWHIVSQKNGFGLSQHTMERVAAHCDKKRGPLGRKIAALKPYLSNIVQGNRIQFCTWALSEVAKGSVYIFTDESYINFGGNPHKKVKRTMPIGQPAESLAIHNKPSIFQMMFWAATCSDTRVKRVCFSWESEKLEEKDQHLQELAKINAYWAERWNGALERARTPGTDEYAQMEDLNRRIADGSTKWKKPRVAEQEFKPAEKQKQWTRGKKDKDNNEVSKGGIDWFLYRVYILVNVLFPYVREVQRMNPGTKVWVIDDNVALHKKAWKSMEGMAEYSDIRKVGFWPSNSPDLHPIERCFSTLKDHVSDYKVVSGTKAEKQRAKDFLKDVWINQMDRCMVAECGSFGKVLQKCIDHQGDNNFRG